MAGYDVLQAGILSGLQPFEDSIAYLVDFACRGLGSESGSSPMY